MLLYPKHVMCVLSQVTPREDVFFLAKKRDRVFCAIMTHNCKDFLITTLDAAHSMLVQNCKCSLTTTFLGGQI